MLPRWIRWLCYLCMFTLNVDDLAVSVALQLEADAVAVAHGQWQSASSMKKLLL